MVCALSHEALGLPVAPLRGRRGISLSSGQTKMCSFLRSLACSVIRLGQKDPGSGLRLPATSDRLSGLREQLSHFADLPYSRGRSRFQHRDGNFTATQALPVVAERLSLPSSVKDFDPTPFLSPTIREIYRCPDRFLKDESEMPAPIKIRGTATRGELLKVMQRWDQLGRLYICRGSEVSSLDRCELFAVAKDVDKDRQILHRKRRNLREKHVPGASKDLPHGVLLCQLPLEGDKICACSVDDVKDFYHAYTATEARARSSPVGPLFRSSEVAHFKAYADAVAEGRISRGEMLACCFKGLGMGDHAAVDIAQESHVNLLKSYGAMIEGEVLRYRDPVPNSQSGFYEGIMIDDHLGVQLLERKGTLGATLKQPGRDQAVFSAAETAYTDVGLEAHPKKRLRRSVHAKVWGTEIEGNKGLIGPTRGRLLSLARLSSEVSRPGAIDQQVLEGTLGLWGFCAQFRRPLFSYMYKVYHESGPEAVDAPFRLSIGARNEFAVLACLAPLCLNDVNAIPDDFLYCVDASPSGAGVCRARVGRDVAREVWRRGDKQGYRCPLLTRFVASLKGCGYEEAEFEDLCEESEPEVEPHGSDGSLGFKPLGEISADVWPAFDKLQGGTGAQPGWRSALPPQLGEGVYDFLELYAGTAQMTDAWAKRGFRVLPPLDVRFGSDLRDQGVFWGILRLVRGSRIRFVWCSPPVSTFSLADVPRLRSREKPWGFKILDEATLVGNLHVAQCFMVGLLQLELGHYFAFEHPAGGFVKSLSPWESLKRKGCMEVQFDWCRFSRSYRKPTIVLTNMLVLRCVGLKCCHHHRHPRLQGRLTVDSGKYSAVFCDQVASCAWDCWDEFREGSEAFRREAQEERRVRLQKGRRKRSSALWAVQLSESLVWKTCMQYTFRSRSHINLQESKARRTLVKRLPRDRRIVICQDSRVNLGALGKGRSPSEALNSVMRTEAAYLLGKNLYVSGVHFPTWSIRADAPSRSQAPSGPRTPLPSWFWGLRQGRPQASETLDDLEGLPRAFNRWFFLAGALLLRASDSCSTTSSARRAPKGAVDQGPSDGRDLSHSRKAVERTGGLADAQDSWLFPGSSSARAHRRFVRMARRIFDLHVSGRQKQASSRGNPEWSQPNVWLAEILACRALGSHQDVGGLGTSAASSADAHPSLACSCGYCSMLAVASYGGALGARLFWAVETCRAYWATQTGPVSSRRPLRGRRALHPGESAKDSAQGCKLSACTAGREIYPQLDCNDGGLHAAVEEDLEWFMVGV